MLRLSIRKLVYALRIHQSFFSRSYLTKTKTEDNAMVSLIATTNKEYQHELERYVQHNESIEYFNTAGFIFIDDKDSTKIKLVKVFETHTLEIMYNAQLDENTEISKDSNNATKLPFSILVLIKDKNGGGLVFDCMHTNDKFVIDSVVYNEHIEEYLPSLLQPGKLGFNPSSCLILTDEMKAGFGSYFESLGITNKLVYCIKQSAANKEQKFYMDWLNQLHEFALNSNNL